MVASRRATDTRLALSLAAGAALVTVVGFLVVANYRSARTLRENLLRQHTQELQLRAASVSYLLSSAEERLRNVADSREVTAFHENLALGMSVQYGLGLSLVPIRQRLSTLVTGLSPPIFERVAMFDERGAVLADSSGGETPEISRAGGSTLRLTDEGRGLALVVPYRFKGQAAGAFVGWLEPQPLVGALGPKARLVDKDERPWRGPHSSKAPWVGAEGKSSESDGQVVEPREPSDDPVVAARVPIEGYSFSLMQRDRARDLLSELSPAQSALSLSVVALLVLGAAGFAVFWNTKALVLSVRLEESLLREREIEEKRSALEREATARRRLEQSQALLAEAVDQAGEAIAITDARGRFSYVNPAFTRTTLWPPDEIIGGRPVDLSSSVRRCRRKLPQAGHPARFALEGRTEGVAKGRNRGTSGSRGLPGTRRCRGHGESRDSRP